MIQKERKNTQIKKSIWEGVGRGGRKVEKEVRRPGMKNDPRLVAEN